MKDTLTYYSLSNAQMDIWLDQKINEGMPIYNIGGFVRIKGEVDKAIFGKAVNCLIKKHDALRIIVDELEGSHLPKQRFLGELSAAVPITDFSQVKDPFNRALFWMQKRFIEPYNNGEPLFRFDLLKVGDQEYLWLAQYHHLITDGWGGALLTRSMSEIYTDLCEGRNPNLNAPSYIEFLKNERSYIQSDKFESDRKYWLDQFKSIPSVLFKPNYLMSASAKKMDGECHTVYLERSTYNRLDGLAKTQRVSVFHVIVSVLLVYFSRAYQQRELVVGLPILNRSNAEFKKTAGLFVGVNPVKFEVGAQLNFDELVSCIGAELRQHYRHQRYPLGEINRSVGVGDVERPQLFDLRINYAKQSHDAFFAGSPVRSVMLDHNVSQTPLSVSVWEFNEKEDVQIDFSFNLGYFKRDEVEAISDRFLHLVDKLLADPSVAVEDIEILTKRDHDQLRFDWNTTQADYPQDRCIHELFEAQAEKAPDAIALTFEDQHLSYGELNQQANQLAHYLVKEKHVSSDTLVGICLERSLDMVIAILGILKAGGAYVPLDPDYPEARLSYMLQDAGLSTVITQSDVLARTPVSSTQALCLDASDTQEKIAAQA
ncbi:MAG: AMP-binding protein, partial [Agarilytica sp.]